MNNDFPVDRTFTLLKCKKLHECGKSEILHYFVECLDEATNVKNRLDAVYGYVDEDTLPLPNKLAKRQTNKRKGDYLCTSSEIEIEDVLSDCIPPNYPNVNIFDSSPLSPIACSSKQTTVVSPTTNTEQGLQSDMKTVIKLLGNMNNAIIENTKMLSQVVSLLQMPERSYQSKTISADNYQFELPLAAEDQLTIFDEALKDGHFRDVVCCKLMTKISHDVKSTLKLMMHYFITPELGVLYTTLGTTKKSAIVNFRFYKLIKSTIISHFVGPLKKESEVIDEIFLSTKSYFHVLRDKIHKRKHRNKATISQHQEDQPEDS